MEDIVAGVAGFIAGAVLIGSSVISLSTVALGNIHASDKDLKEDW